MSLLYLRKGRPSHGSCLWWSLCVVFSTVLFGVMAQPGSARAMPAAKPQSAQEVAKEAATLAKGEAEAAKARSKTAVELVAKAKAKADNEADVAKRVELVGLLGSISSKADEAVKAAEASAKAAERAELASKTGNANEALQAAAEAKSAAGDAAAAVKAAGELLDPPPASIDSGDSAWMLTSSALVLFMVPGLALFYAGMVRRKNALGTVMHSMVALAIIGVQWVVVGYAFAFGDTRLAILGDAGVIGWSWDLVCLNGKTTSDVFPAFAITWFVHMMFQGKFAIITPALISGAIAERVKFSTYCIFILLWGILVYNPMAHWVWWDGFLGYKGIKAMDFAGGTVVHLSAGASALACILLLGKRRLADSEPAVPHSLVLTLVGAAMLWFGWFGFNAGSALGAGAQAGQAFATTQTATAAAGLVWMLIEWLHRGRPTALGLASGLVAGLVGITPAAGFVNIFGGLVIGVAAAGVCYAAVVFVKPLLGYDDTLDVVGVHGVGGLVGALLTGVFFISVPGDDFMVNGELPSIPTQFVRQLIGVVIAGVYAFSVTAVLTLILEYTLGFRLSEEAEMEGLDQSQHGESAYHI